ncbi:unnamed protein product [Ectocarpus sp. CCAP 1310/34]|nr:unnamed protein product [Ectocarpus sp. CCAP 1310/34]
MSKSFANSPAKKQKPAEETAVGGGGGDLGGFTTVGLRKGIQVLEDNQGAMALVQNPLSSGRTKHIDVRFHFIRGLFRSGEISVKFVPTTEQHADLLTKALSRASLQYHRRKLMNLPE